MAYIYKVMTSLFNYYNCLKQWNNDTNQQNYYFVFAVAEIYEIHAHKI